MIELVEVIQAIIIIIMITFASFLLLPPFFALGTRIGVPSLYDRYLDYWVEKSFEWEEKDD